MKKYLSTSILPLFLFLVSSSVSAQLSRSGLRAASSQPISELSQSVTCQQKEATPFGQALVERLKAEGRQLPLPEDKMLRLRPGRRHYVKPVEAGEQPLAFSGMLQYNEYKGRMLLEYGFYKFSQKNGFRREVMADVDRDLNGRGAYYNHKLHGVGSIELPYLGSGNWTYAEWDTDTWEPTGQHGTRLNANSLIVKDADWDPVTGNCYGWKEESSSNYTFLRLDYENMGREIIATSDSLVVMLAINSQGEMYGVTENGSFCSIDKQNGRLTYIGSLDFPFYSVFESMTFDRRTDRLYMVATEIDEDSEEMMGRLCEVDVTTGHTTLIAYLPEAEEYTCLNVLYEPADDAPADIEQMVVNFPSEVGAGVGIAGFTVPTTTIGGSELTGKVHYVLTFNDDDADAVEGDADPGQYVAKVINPKSEGRQKVVVVLSQNGLEGHRNVAVGWIGQDTPAATNVRLTIDEATGQATLSWQGNIGARGGFVNDALTYDIYRHPGAVKVVSAISATTFSESLASEKYNAFYYRVVPFRGEEEGVSGQSNSVMYGTPYEVPFTDNFEDADAGSAYTTVDVNGDGKTWDFVHFASTGGRMRYDYSKYVAADDWALTPPIHLVEGVAYEIAFKANSIATVYKERLSVACGQGLDPAAYEVIIPETVVATTSLQSPVEMKGEIKVTRTGDYHFGFRCTSPAMQNALMIDDIAVTAGQLLITPDSVRNLRLTAGEDGDLVVTIDFDAPSVANDGSPLDKLTRIEITRGQQNDAVTTLTDVEPGKHYTYVDEDAVNGEVVYKVTAYNEAGAGLTATATIYVGTDAPAAPVSVALSDNLDGTATLTWQAPASGQNGGYIDPDELTYNIYGVVNNTLERIKSDIDGMTYTVGGIPQTGAQGQIFYGVTAENELGESAAAMAAPLIFGAPYTLPFMEGFHTSGLKGIWGTRSSDGATSWRMYTGFSSDGDDCVTAVESERAGVTAMLTSGKISLAGAVNPKLVFSAFGDPGTKNRLKVAIQKNGEARADTVIAVSYAEQKIEDFITYAVDLTAYRDAKYITVTFVAELNDPRLRLIVIDDVNVRNVNAYDLAAYPKMQARTTAGQMAHMAVTVHNVGEQQAKGYQVDFFVNGNCVKSVTDEQGLAPFARALYEFDYLTGAIDPEQSKVWATVTYDLDLDEADNNPPSQPLMIIPSQLEGVDMVTATADGDRITLRWTPVEGRHAVTDSFEGYESFRTAFGQWGNHDADHAPTAGINGLWWPGMNAPQAFMTFNFAEAGVTPELMRQNPQFEANSGTQFVACFKAIDAPGNRNNDWLVAPELSGGEQTVTIYAQSLAGTMSEKFEVLYSAGGCDVADFVADNRVGTYEAPNGYFGRFRVSLPAGARYFAIHCISQYGGILMLDDISYEGRRLTLKGYNIYCDGRLVAVADVQATTFDHSTAGLTTGLHTYHVTAVYDEGESPLSNGAPVAVINGLGDVAARQPAVSTRAGSIVIAGAKGLPVTVCNMKGQTVYSGTTAADTAVIPVAAGQYLVRAGSMAANVLVGR